MRNQRWVDFLRSTAGVSMSLTRSAGCFFEAILAAVGIDPPGFGPDADPRRRSKE